MARTKKVEPQVQEPVQEPVQEVPEPTPARELVLPPDAKLVPVKCTVPGFEKLTVYFKTNNLWRLVNEPESIPNQDGWGVARHLMLVARRFEGWDYDDELSGEKISAPQPPNLDSYKHMVLNHSDFLPLTMWCIGEGYREALNSLTKN